jgi:hypothetical protein
MADKNTISKENQKQIEDLNDQLNLTNQKIQDIGSNLSKGLRNQLIGATEATRTLADNLSKSKDITKDINKITSELNKANTKNTKLSIEKNISEQKLNELIKQQGQMSKKDFDTALKRAKNDLARTTTALKLHEITEDDLRTLLKIAEAEKKITEEKKKQNSVAEAVRDKIKSINKEYFSTLGILKFILNAALASDEQTTALAKSLGLSKAEAKGVRDNMVEFSRVSDNSFVNVTRLFKAQQALTEQLGIAVDFGGQEQETFARLTEIVGLSADEAGKLAKFSAVTGKSTKEYVSNVRVAAMAAMQANKIHISDKELLSSISKLSAGILVKFNQNPKALAEAVVQAKKLGTSLEEVNSIGNSLLDWQTSIGNELEAELLTNRKLNFEAARYAALTGDQATLMAEVAKQAGSLAEYQDMNVLAQESLAKAFGMNRDQMSDMLMKQEMINKYGDAAAQLNKEQLEDMQKRNMSAEEYLDMVNNQRSIQEKFNDAILKLQDLIGNLVAGPLGRMLDIMISITEHTKFLAALASIYIARLIVINALKARQYILDKKDANVNIVKAISAAVGSAASMGPLGWVVGIGLAAGLYATLTGMFDKGDDVISAGYGKRMLLDKGSVTAFNDNDTIVAGTNLGGGNRGGGGGGNGMEVVAAIRDMHNELKNTNSKPAVAYINGKDAFADNLGRSNSLGTSQVQNSYRLA